MGRNLDDIYAALPPEKRAKIDARAAQLMTEYETLQELRKAMNVTQEQMARDLGVKQENISRLEKRSDMLLSTLARAIGALGGKLDLTVRFADRPPVSLTKLVEAELHPSTVRRLAAARRAKPHPAVMKKAPRDRSSRARTT